MFFGFDLIRDSSTSLLPASLSQLQNINARIAKLSLKMNFLIKMFDHFKNGVVPDHLTQHRKYLEELQQNHTSRQAFKLRLDQLSKLAIIFKNPIQKEACLNAIKELEHFPILEDPTEDPNFLFTIEDINQSRKSSFIELVESVGLRLFHGKLAFLSKEDSHPREFQVLFKKTLRVIPNCFLFKTKRAIKKLASTSNRLFALSELSSTRSSITYFTENSSSADKSLSYRVDYCEDFHLSDHTLSTIGKDAEAKENILKLYKFCDDGDQESLELDTILTLGEKPRCITAHGDFAGIITRTKKVAILKFNNKLTTELYDNFDSPTCIDMDSTHFVIGNSIVWKYKTSKLNLIDYKTGKQSKKLRAHQGDITVVKLTKDHIYSGGKDRFVKIWARESFQLISQTEFTSAIKEVVVPNELRIGNFFVITENDNGVTYVSNLTSNRKFFPYENITALHYAHQNLYIGTSKGECIRIDPRFFALKV